MSQITIEVRGAFNQSRPYIMQIAQPLGVLVSVFNKNQATTKKFNLKNLKDEPSINNNTITITTFYIPDSNRSSRTQKKSNLHVVSRQKQKLIQRSFPFIFTKARAGYELSLTFNSREYGTTEQQVRQVLSHISTENPKNTFVFKLYE